MTKISNTDVYAAENPISDNDYIIGTNGDSTNLETKTFFMDVLKSYITTGLTVPINPMVVKTYAEISALITANNLVPGTIYNITGTHPTLYDDGTTSGTAIYLLALSTNQLAKEGYGEFYNPKYNQAVPGFGVWSANASLNGTRFASPVGVFTNGESITSNNGATAQMINIPFHTNELGSDFFTIMILNPVGDWDTSTQVIGDSSGATLLIADNIPFDVKRFNQQTYVIGDQTIWGGYSWTNVNGLLGSNNDVLQLDAEWTKDIYSLTDYNKVFDVIEYDYENDWISRRYEVINDNNITFTFEDSLAANYNYSLSYSAISVFMFGNNYDFSTLQGIGNNKIENSYFECVDFRGNYIKNNNLTQDSAVYNNNFDTASNIFNNNIRFGGINGNIFSYASVIKNNDIAINSGIRDNKFIKSTVSSSSLSLESLVSDNKCTDGLISNNILSNSSIYENVLQTFGNIQGNQLVASYISNNMLTVSSGIVENILNTSNISVSLSFPFISKILKQTEIKLASIAVDITAATILYANYPKTIYKSSTGAYKLRYYNDTAVVIASITA